MSASLRKRFWQHVSVVPQDTAFVLFLDDRPLRLPGGSVLGLPTAALAAAVAEEWRLAGGGIGEIFGPDDLVLTGLAGSLQERVAPAPRAIVDLLHAHAATDLLCYRASSPASLVQQQEGLWQPWLDWLEHRHGVRLAVTSGVMPIGQDTGSMARLHRMLCRQSPVTLTGLGAMVPVLGSVVLGLAVASGELESMRAVELARLDESFQARLWGMQPETEAATGRMRIETALAARFISLATPVDAA
ncbi:ATP12 family protein [Lichenicoccus roseus]|uniref:ATP12 family protein n=1 Tax=Lichenicoccus roseus TaxID=2683649 RepID=UPI0014860A38|nr:ATP12 family protein [Lichenicoccus roseus]